MFGFLAEEPAKLNIAEHLWVIVVIAVILCILLGIIILFGVVLRKLKKANNGYPGILKKEKSEEELLQQMH